MGWLLPGLTYLAQRPHEVFHHGRVDALTLKESSKASKGTEVLRCAVRRSCRTGALQRIGHDRNVRTAVVEQRTEQAAETSKRWFVMTGSNLTNEKVAETVSFRDFLVGLTEFEPATPWRIRLISGLRRSSRELTDSLVFTGNRAVRLVEV